MANTLRRGPRRENPEAKWQRDVLKLASANGWKYDIEDCQPRYQPESANALLRFFMNLTKPLHALFARDRMEFPLAYHTYDSRGSGRGFPDLVLVHPRRSRIIFAELKTDAKYPTTEQRFWLAALTYVTRHIPSIDVVVWRPKDRPEVVQTLGGIDFS